MGSCSKIICFGMERNATRAMECIHTLHIEAKAVPLHMESHGLKRHQAKNKVPAEQQLGTRSSTDYSTDSGVPYTWHFDRKADD